MEGNVIAKSTWRGYCPLISHPSKAGTQDRVALGSRAGTAHTEPYRCALDMAVKGLGALSSPKYRNWGLS
jgi:hypothetical protein